MSALPRLVGSQQCRRSDKAVHRCRDDYSGAILKHGIVPNTFPIYRCAAEPWPLGGGFPHPVKIAPFFNHSPDRPMPINSKNKMRPAVVVNGPHVSQDLIIVPITSRHRVTAGRVRAD